MKKISHICASILETIKGGQKFIFAWTPTTNELFELLKKKVAEQPILAFPTFNKIFTIECDASNLTTGAIISQEGRAIEFFSEKLNEAKRKYSSYVWNYMH